MIRIYVFTDANDTFRSRKIDIRLLFILGALCESFISKPITKFFINESQLFVDAAAYIDRINVSIARVAGMGTDLQLQVGERYS